MMIASAGHVDHGKTTLVQALTGINTDRLAEEQRRGMTIEPGFAYAHWHWGGQPLAQPVGFVDVPGHEGFVRNMLVGLTGVDLGLLVVAADDGPMPQTREHLAILSLLKVPKLVVAITKTDRVSAARLAQAHGEISTLLADGPYARAPLFEVAAKDASRALSGPVSPSVDVALPGAQQAVRPAVQQTAMPSTQQAVQEPSWPCALKADLLAPVSTGVEALRQHLALAAHTLETRPITGHFRMAVDRSFSIAGAGRVVTGAVLSGQVQVGDEVLVSPAGTPVRVRSLFAQNQSADRAQVGQRCALNLVGPALKRAQPQRGDWVLHAPAHAPTQRLDGQLHVLASESVPLSTRSTYQLHVGAAVVNAHVLPLAGNPLLPGSVGLAQLVLDKPVATAHADRFILREPAANRTVAGGWVVNPYGPQRGQTRPLRLARLQTELEPDAAQALAAATALEPMGLDLRLFALCRNLRVDEISQLCDQLALRRVPATGGAIALTAAQWQACCQRAMAALEHWHQQYPHSLGPPRVVLMPLMNAAYRLAPEPSPALASAPMGAQKATSTVSDQTAKLATQPASKLAVKPTAKIVFEAVLAALVDQGLIAQRGLRYQLPHHVPLLSADHADWLQRITAHLPPTDLRPPIVGELAARLGTTSADVLAQLTHLAANGHLVRVALNRFYRPSTVALLFDAARQLAHDRADGCIDAASYRDCTGIGRNLTVQVLEFMQREGFTRFDGSRHHLLH